MEDDVNEWLKSQAEVGRTDSIGEFTLDPAKAWAKLGASGLPTTYSWVLKIVQSAVRFGVGLDIQQSREETVFTWTAPVPWTHEQLSGAIFSVEGCQEDRALNHLAVAVRALVASRSDFKFWIQYSDGVRAEWTGSDFTMSSRRASSSTPLALGVGHRTTNDGAPIQLASVGAEIARILCVQCHLSPRKITLDQREISSIFEDPNFGRPKGYQLLGLLSSPPSESGPNLRVRANFTGSFTPWGLKARLNPDVILKATRSLATSASAAGMMIYSPSDPKLISQLAWVQDGVEVFRDNLSLAGGPIALLVACSAEGLETDISGMTLRDTPEKRRRMLETLERIGHCLQDSGKVLSELPESSPLPSVAAGVAGLFLCLVSPVIGCLTLGGSVLGLLSLTSKEGVEISEIQKDIQYFAAALAEYVSSQKAMIQ